MLKYTLAFSSRLPRYRRFVAGDMEVLTPITGFIDKGKEVECLIKSVRNLNKEIEHVNNKLATQVSLIKRHRL
jgi:valyl-tRNA synthetase